MRVVVYTRSNNKSPVKDFINKLGATDRARLLACLKNVEDLGLDSPRVQFRQIRGHLWEIKIRLQSTGVRLFYVVLKAKTLVLLHGYKKQSQKAPKKEIETAEKRMLEVLKNERDYFR